MEVILREDLIDANHLGRNRVCEVIVIKLDAIAIAQGLVDW